MTIKHPFDQIAGIHYLPNLGWVVVVKTNSGTFFKPVEVLNERDARS